jgi:hypothetical protein
VDEELVVVALVEVSAGFAGVVELLSDVESDVAVDAAEPSDAAGVLVLPDPEAVLPDRESVL